MATEDLTRVLDEPGVRCERAHRERVPEAEALRLVPADAAKTLS